MKSIVRIFIRFVIAVVGIALLLLCVNGIFLVVWGYHMQNRSQVGSHIVSIAQDLTKQGDTYVLNKKGEKVLQEWYQWGMLLDGKGAVVWAKNLPEELPRQYSLQQVAQFTRWYLMDYPVDVWIHDDGLLVLGNAKNSYWKYGLEYPEKAFRTFPLWFLRAIVINGLVALLLFCLLCLWVFRSLQPLAQGIESLSQKQKIQLATTGMMGDLAEKINKTSLALQQQEMALQKRDMARSNWIAGISHDIRTPLSLVLGYASQLEENQVLPEPVKEQAGIIRRQGMKIKCLVNDLNLAAKLEYEMQPIHREPVHPAQLLRKTVAEFLNIGLDRHYTLDLQVEPEVEAYYTLVDQVLLQRALSNIIQNCIEHNPQGCNIFIKMYILTEYCNIVVADDGIGIKEDSLKRLRTSHHYMVSDHISEEQRHGLGLLIVEQILKAHEGRIDITSKVREGVQVRIWLPLFEKGI